MPDIHLDPKIRCLPRAPGVFGKILSTDKLLLKLPRPGALAGQVIRHATQVLESTLTSNAPMVYKIGFSYDPHNRFYNKSFGYVLDRQRWERMIIVYVSAETMGPAFLEAALIQQFKGLLFQWMKVLPLFIVSVYSYLYILYIYVYIYTSYVRVYASRNRNR